MPGAVNWASGSCGSTPRAVKDSSSPLAAVGRAFSPHRWRLEAFDLFRAILISDRFRISPDLVGVPDYRDRRHAQRLTRRAVATLAGVAPTP
jgi:hypothetical protein